MKKTTAYARKRAHMSAFDRHRHRSINKVTEAVVTANIAADIQRLRDGVGLHAFMGDNAQLLTNLCGRLVYIVCHAARRHGLEETPEARILAGTANALGELHDQPGSLDDQRATIQSGIGAIDRLMPNLNTLSLAEGALELDALLQNSDGMFVSEIRKALSA